MGLLNKIVSKLISGAVCAILAGLAMHMDHVHGQQLGREAFLAKEAARYDRHFAHPDPVIVDIIAGIFLFFILFAIYEAMAFVIFKILEKLDPSEEQRHALIR